MAFPNKYTRKYNFEDFQASNPADPLPASQVESELNEVKTVTDGIIDFVKNVQRSDGKLVNGSVHTDAFSTAALALMGGSWTPKGAWVTATAYVAGDVVTNGGITYVANTAHTAAALFSTDDTAGYWTALGENAAAATYDNSTSNLDATTVAAALDEISKMAGSFLEKDVAGSSDATLTAAEADNAILKFTGTLTGNINVIVPTEKRRWVVDNATSGAFTVTVKTSAGSGVAVTQGKKAYLYGDGTDVVKFFATDDFQAANTNLTALAGLTGAADRLAYFTGLGAMALATLTSFGRSLIAAANAAAARTTLGLVIGTDVLAPDGDGSQLTNVPGASSADMRLAFLLIAENAGDRVNMVDGIADPFADETDVDTGASTNQTYDASGDFYHSPATNSGAISGATGSNIGDLTSGGGLAAAFDGTTSQAQSACANRVSSSSGYVGKDYSAAPKRVFKATIHGSNDNGYVGGANPSVTITLRGKNGSAPTPYTSDGTSLGSITFTDDANEAAGRDITSSDTTTEWDYVWAEITYSAGTVTVSCAELVIHESSGPGNMTLVSNAFTADAAPDTGRAHVQVVENESITINTDLTFEISRDNGTTWTAATLALVETLADGTKAYEDATVDISGQPSGTSMKWRVKTLNNPDVEIHGVIEQWD